MRWKRPIAVLLLVLTVLSVSGVFTGCAETKKDIIRNAEQLNAPQYSIGVHPGSLAAVVAEEKFPNATIVNQSTITDSYLSVENGKTDAFIYEKLYMQYAVASEALNDLALMEDTVGHTDIAVGINPARGDLLPKVNDFIKQIKKDGTFDEMYDRWVLKADKQMPDIPKPTAPEMTIRIGTSGLIEPMNYYDANQQLTGFDVEFIYRMAAYLNAEVQLEAMSFDALVASLESGKLDAVVSDLNVTEERKEIILMSDPYMDSEIGLLVRSDRLEVPETQYTEVNQLNGKKIGIVAGSSYQTAVGEVLPDSEIVAVNTNADVILALKNRKIEGYVVDEPLARMQVAAVSGITALPETITKDDYAYVLRLGNTDLADSMNLALAEMKNEGEIDRLIDKWMNVSGDQTVLPDPNADTSKGLLRVVTSNDVEPFCFLKDGQAVGYDIELITRIAEKIGYAVELKTVDSSALLPSVIADKADVAIGCITITEERAETVLFTNPVYYGGTVAVVRSQETARDGFFAGIASSFRRTFVTENRWQLVLNGLLVTLWLSAAAAVLGTLLGFLVSFPLRSKNKLVAAPSNAISTFLGGMPLVLILMVLYYIVFKNVNISATWVGVFGLTLDFANTVAGLLNTGLSAVDKGQLEAAAAMGYNRRQIFWKIAFPQAANQMFSQYEGAIVGLVKGSSIVGYITVEDLTKAGDIIRSRTYEAFFPLIATAIIYFLLAYALVLLLKRVSVKLDPKHRPRKVAGVKEK